MRIVPKLAGEVDEGGQRTCDAVCKLETGIGQCKGRIEWIGKVQRLGERKKVRALVQCRSRNGGEEGRCGIELSGVQGLVGAVVHAGVICLAELFAALEMCHNLCHCAFHDLNCY
jgi:hypothetical protein